MSLTPAQHEAISARGNVLVAAGAGTGKTRTLVERCLACLLSGEPPASIDEILMVTFTEAAAAEMRHRIRRRLEEENQRQSDNARWQEQLALFETAHIGTLHSFCLQLVRQHFYELELDPQISVLAEPEARLLADETLDVLLQRHYAGRSVAAQAVQRLIQTQARGWDKPIRTLVLRLHHYGQTLPNPAAWLESQLAVFATPEPLTWRLWLRDAITGFRAQWLARLDSRSGSNTVSAQCAAALRNFPTDPSPDALAAAFSEITGAAQSCPRGKKALWLDPLEDFFAEAAFLSSLTPIPGRSDPLAEDWTWVRGEMTTLLELCREFTQSFSEAKRELGVVDFHDLEQFSLRLLWEHTTDQPSRVAQHWRKKLRFIFVDEYQDINAAQDLIIQALGREGSQANRFLVGDVKQSIYRFRLANPAIFQKYADQWSGEQGRVLPLVDNFRSKERLLNLVNSVFSLLIHRELGGVDYASGAALRFGAPQDREPLSAIANAAPAVELHLLLKGGVESQDDETDHAEALAEVFDLQVADQEARLVALRLRELHEQRLPVWDDQSRQFRPVDWADMAVLLRSPANKAESYAKEFARLNLPLQVARAGFYRSLEVTDLLSLLQLLDNPLQDLPALAVLHSPLVGLTVDELAEIRLTALKARFWSALTRWHHNNLSIEENGTQSTDRHRSRSKLTGPLASPETFRKVSTFLARFARWRRLARQGSLSRCLEAVLAETHYASWLMTQPRGALRHANVQRLISLAQEFDQFQRQGLFRFVKFVEAQQEAESEPEIAGATIENAVRLMSIHQSKGLEFPVVVVADLGKRFNLADLRADIILDETYGPCPQIKPPHTGTRYPSLPYWLARRRQLRELLGEELRLLYVAMTRAQGTLILSGALPFTKFSAHWQKRREISDALLLEARNYCDWLGLWFSQNIGAEAQGKESGDSPLLRWYVHDQAKLATSEALPQAAPTTETPQIEVSSEGWSQLQRKLSWQYPYAAATRQPAKTSVSALRRQTAADQDDEAADLFSPADLKTYPADRRADLSRPLVPKAKLSAADVGSAYHKFLQLVALDRTGTAAALKDEALRLRQLGGMAPEQVAVLDFDSLAHFWNSKLGHRVRAQAQFVQRELAFTARFSPTELAALQGHAHDPGLEREAVLVQGVADLAVITPKEIWLLDFKTDQLAPDELNTRVNVYQQQVKLYAAALSRIYQRPVSESWLYFFSLKQKVAVI